MKTAVSGFLALCALVAAPARAAETNFDGGYWLSGPVTLSVDVSGATAEGSADSSTLYQAVRDAAARWNAALKLPLLRVESAALPDRAFGNGRNEFVFSSDISPGITFADQFGSVAPRRGGSGRLLECDLVFNPAHPWLVYRGPLQYDADNERIPDLYRVALHEFGHLIGMDHPASDAEVTIMRSKMSDVDDLTPQDLRDARIASDTLIFVNGPRLLAPRTPRLVTTAAKVTLRGTAAPFFTPTLVLRATSDGKTRRYVLHPGKSWRKILPLPRGRTVLRGYYRTRFGKLERFAARTIVAR